MNAFKKLTKAMQDVGYVCLSHIGVEQSPYADDEVELALYSTDRPNCPAASIAFVKGDFHKLSCQNSSTLAELFCEAVGKIITMRHSALRRDEKTGKLVEQFVRIPLAD